MIAVNQTETSFPLGSEVEKILNEILLYSSTLGGAEC
jgi:hypothetical protein